MVSSDLYILNISVYLSKFNHVSKIKACIQIIRKFYGAPFLCLHIHLHPFSRYRICRTFKVTTPQVTYLFAVVGLLELLGQTLDKDPHHLTPQISLVCY